VATRSGVPATTLRYYEEVGLLVAPSRVAGRRRYDPTVFDRLVVINAARRAGLTLREVGRLVEAMTDDGTAGEAWRTVAARKLPEVDSMIAELRAARELLRAVADCQCSSMSDCADLLAGSRLRGADGC